MSIAEKLTTIAENEQKVYDKGVADGKKSEYDEFWDEYQNKGKQMDWGSYAFAGRWWNDKTFNPKYDIVVGRGDAGNYFANNAVTNLRDKIDRRGLKLDLTQGTTAISSFFRSCYSVEIPDFDSGNCIRMNEIFYESNVQTIPRFNMTSCTTANNAFYKASSLQNITFEGTIPISISFSYSPLTVASLKSIITHLKDYSGTTSEYTYTVTFKASAFAALEAEGNTSPNGNTWTEYIDDLKWNLALA